MANTVGHTMRRYHGHKLYLAMIAQRKAVFVADEGADASEAPFWDEAICQCARCERCEAEALRNIAEMADDPGLWYAHEMRDQCERAMIEAMSQPEPAITITGRLVCVEWECESGYRYWETMDEGEVDRAIWQGKMVGRLLSDIDEPANVGRPLGHGDEAPSFYA